MKTILAATLITISTYANAYVNFDQATQLQKQQITKYFLEEGYIDDANDASIEMDDGRFYPKMVKCDNGQTYEYMKMYLGDTEAGPLYNPGTLELVAANGDGDYYHMEENRYMDCEEI